MGFLLDSESLWSELSPSKSELVLERLLFSLLLNFLDVRKSLRLLTLGLTKDINKIIGLNTGIHTYNSNEQMSHGSHPLILGVVGDEPSQVSPPL